MFAFTFWARKIRYHTHLLFWTPLEQTRLCFTGKQRLALCLQLVKTLRCQPSAEPDALSDVRMFGMG